MSLNLNIVWEKTMNNLSLLLFSMPFPLFIEIEKKFLVLYIFELEH